MALNTLIYSCFYKKSLVVEIVIRGLIFYPDFAYVIVIYKHKVKNYIYVHNDAKLSRVSIYIIMILNQQTRDVGLPTLNYNSFNVSCLLGSYFLCNV